MKPNDKFRFLKHPSYERDEVFTVSHTAEDFIACYSNKRPDTLHAFYRYEVTFRMFPVEWLDDAGLMMAAANAILNTPVGEYIDFSRTLQEL